GSRGGEDSGAFRAAHPGGDAGPLPPPRFPPPLSADVPYLRYGTAELTRVLKSLLYTGRAKSLAGLDLDDPGFFLPPSEYVDVLEILAAGPSLEVSHFRRRNDGWRAAEESKIRGGGREEGRNAEEGKAGGLGAGEGRAKQSGAGEGRAKQSGGGEDVRQSGAASPALLQPAPQANGGSARWAATEWVYRDPQGREQGPFPASDILEWYHAGYFPLDLSLRPAGAPGASPEPFRALGGLLQEWQTPPAADPEP
ncbi:hypothetical protein H632_c4691p0, partial [Helicosporidium sp. ATCC 50920]